MFFKFNDLDLRIWTQTFEVHVDSLWMPCLMWSSYNTEKKAMHSDMMRKIKDFFKIVRVNGTGLTCNFDSYTVSPLYHLPAIRNVCNRGALDFLCLLIRHTDDPGSLCALGQKPQAFLFARTDRRTATEVEVISASIVVRRRSHSTRGCRIRIFTTEDLKLLCARHCFNVKALKRVRTCN